MDASMTHASLQKLARRVVALAALLVVAVAASGCNKLKARDLLNKGVTAFKNGQSDAAIEDFKEAKEADPELLNARLADAIDLQTQTKHAHWNVKGPNFIALHELFDKINEDVEDYVDDIAERAVQLGGIAEGTARLAAKRSSLSEYPANTVDGRAHADALSSVLAAFGKSARDLGKPGVNTETGYGLIQLPLE